MTRLVGLDVGTTGIKAVTISAEGEVLARAEEPYPLSTPRPGWAEQDPAAWWRASEAALAEVGADGADGIGLSGQMHGLVALDEADRVLRPAILWNDQRTAAECVEIEDRLGLERLVALTGNRALTGFTAPKLLWMRRHEPEIFGRIEHVLLPKDYVRLRLGGEKAIDVADASGTLLFDVQHRRWSEEMLEALELPRESAVARITRGLRRDGGRRSDCGRRRRSGCRCARGRCRQARRALGRARHVWRRLRGPPALPGRP